MHLLASQRIFTIVPYIIFLSVMWKSKLDFSVAPPITVKLSFRVDMPDKIRNYNLLRHKIIAKFIAFENRRQFFQIISICARTERCFPILKRFCFVR